MMYNAGGSVTNDSKAGRYTVFNCQKYDFAIAISDVQEVLAYPRVTRLPNAEPFINGVFNLRGKIYTVFDLRQLLDIETDEARDQRMVILTGKPGGTIGIAVDRVKEMITLPDNKISAPGDDLPASFRRFVSGHCTIADGRIYFIDIARMLTGGAEQG